jgi:NADPH:quinone reductase-like Zn-dependent oxidoreductase
MITITTTGTTTTMKAIRYDSYGGPEVLQYADIPTPTPESDQVLVRVEAASINAADYRLMRADPFLARFGAGLRRPHKWPVLGSDLAGVVEAVGSEVTDLVVGDRVFGDSFADGRGSFAEFVCVSSSSLAPIPDGLSATEAAAVPLAAMTALQAIRDLGHVEPGQSVFVHGAGGGVGTMAVQIAKAYGADVTAMCGPRSVAVAESAGADRIIDYSVEHIPASGSYDLVLGVNGYQPLSTYRRLLKDGGRYVTIGGTTRTLMDALLLAKLAFLFSGKKAAILTIDDDKRSTDLQELVGLIKTGQLRPYVDRTFPLDRTADAMRYVETGHVPGKVVLTVDR